MKNAPKKIVVLGSTGSLGTQILELLSAYGRHFQVIGLSANKNEQLLKKQAKKFGVKNIALTPGEILHLASLKEADIVVNVISGYAGIAPTIAVLKAGKILLLGNKESLFAEGGKIMKLAKTATSEASRIIPLDSEHNAIFEILKKYPERKIKKIILPCSGGPFWGKSPKELEKMTPAQATAHPKWKMGTKISLESATLINKGFEIIEAHHLFKVPLSKIEIRLHPECVLHGAVEFDADPNGGIKSLVVGYFGEPDMSEHLENALMHCIGISPKKGKIKAIKLDKYTDEKISFNTLGIKTVTRAFHGGIKSRKNFLKMEEEVLNKFTSGKISFSRILEAISYAQKDHGL